LSFLAFKNFPVLGFMVLVVSLLIRKSQKSVHNEQLPCIFVCSLYTMAVFNDLSLYGTANMHLYPTDLNNIY